MGWEDNSIYWGALPVSMEKGALGCGAEEGRGGRQAETSGREQWDGMGQSHATPLSGPHRMHVSRVTCYNTAPWAMNVVSHGALNT